ncbi:multicopper oxidase domain-containing protein [Okeania sp. SIO2C2]|uniref:multicopper oxidase domain-containing protein n=1 Tax=Okeania sp. SIO2C2 TaxID=2607787 RepID=UPI00257E4484|nr:multicopper oxidase domain-containing protein [Okeania sp. SIO2C2]
MANPLEPEKSVIWNRRQFLKLGLVGSGVTLAGITTQHILPKLSSSLEARAAINTIELNPTNTLREFDYGIIKQENGRQIREFQIKAINSKLQLNQAVSFISWNYNGRVPGPTLRATEGERVRIIFENEGGHAHTMHFHGIHPAEVDGVRPVRHGKTTIYEFDAQPFGVHLYHCHITPVTRHVSKGLYGMFIVDPPNSRPPADEDEMASKYSDIGADIQANMTELKKAWPSAIAPEIAAMKPAKVSQLIEEIKQNSEKVG